MLGGAQRFWPRRIEPHDRSAPSTLRSGGLGEGRSGTIAQFDGYA
jgi:hypothetical protein